MATHIRQAVGTDVAVVSSILREAAAWLTEQHMAMWRADELGDERIRADVERAGFQHHSDRQVGPYFVSRYERRISSRDRTTPPSPQAARIALIGDFDPAVEAHQAIPRALALACDATEIACDWTWIHTTTLGHNPAAQLADFDGVWCVPASPYANTRGVLAAIRFAREHGRPFLGTCGGFQYALLEYAEAAWGLARPAHGELDPGADDPLIAPLACSLVEESGEIFFTPESALASIYDVPSRVEKYHCRYGLNPRYAHRLVTGPLHVSGRDVNGEVRAVELRGHPFFVATLFQPERSAWSGRPHPLIVAFMRTIGTAAISVRRPDTV